LIEALKYVTSLANLKYKVEAYAVAIVPASVNTETLIQKEYKVPPVSSRASPRGATEAPGLRRLLQVAAAEHGTPREPVSPSSVASTRRIPAAEWRYFPGGFIRNVHPDNKPPYRP
jgi:hypothetical protein